MVPPFLLSISAKMISEIQISFRFIRYFGMANGHAPNSGFPSGFLGLLEGSSASRPAGSAAVGAGDGYPRVGSK